MKKLQPSESESSLRALIIGIILIPINSYWIMETEVVWYSGHPTIVSLFFNVIFNISILVLLNFTLKRFRPKIALTQKELVLIYTMLSISSAICGHDMVEILVPILGHAFWFATPENEWKELFWSSIPAWLSLQDRKVLTGYYEGHSSLYSWENLKAWILPVSAWASFIFALLFIMICINSLVRKQWTEREKLSYPIIQLPLQMTGDELEVFKKPLLWLGLASAFGVDFINGLRYFFPIIPEIPITSRIGNLFTERPWNAIGGLQVNLYPFVIGLGFFIPLDLSFSCWFFFWVWRLQLVLASVLGLRGLPQFPYINDQSAGGYLALCIIAIYATKNHLKLAFKKAINRKFDYDESREPLKYRTALLGIGAGMGYITLFGVKAGLALGNIFIFFLIYFMLSTAIARVRAELGSPVHDLHYAGPEFFIVKMTGTRRQRRADLTVMSLFWFITRAYRSHPMPHQLEGFKLAERTGLENKKLLLGMIIAIILGTFSAFWALLDLSYRFGAANRIVGPALIFGREPFDRLQRWLSYPTEPDYPALTFTAIGLLFTIFLAFMRMKFFWWQWHPVGYAVSSSWGMNVFWACLFISWLIKGLILKYGGLKAHRKAIPLFLGFILGECLSRSIWALISVVFSIPTGTGHW